MTDEESEKNLIFELDAFFKTQRDLMKIKTSRSSKASKRRGTNPRPASEPQWLDLADALQDRLARIATVSGLLSAVSDPCSLDTKLASDAGYIIGDELRQAKALLAQTLKAKNQEPHP